MCQCLQLKIELFINEKKINIGNFAPLGVKFCGTVTQQLLGSVL